MNVLDWFRLDGKRFFITGGSRGLGRAMALALAEAGADGVIVGRDADSLARVSDEIRARGRGALTISADVSDPEACRAACARAWNEAGPLDIVINNAGGRRDPVPLVEQSLESWRTLIDLNLTSAFAATRELAPRMIARGAGGRIINVASINAFVATRGIGGRHYETAKAALVQLTRAAAVDLAPHGVTVNAICPGGFWTDANLRWRREKPEVIANFQANIPLGDLGQPEDLGPLAVYLASNASRYMTGAVLVIDGGYTLW